MIYLQGVGDIMSFDGILLKRLIKEFEPLKSGRISKIIESGDTDFLFTIRANHINYNLMLSFSSDFARIHLTNRIYDAPQNPKSFTMFLRKHIEGYFIDSIETYHCDRVIYFKLQGYNEMQDFKIKYLICEIMGRYSNLILTDENYVIIDSLKHDGVGEYNRTILPNAIYEFPKTDKLNPLDYTEDELTDIIIKNKLQTPKDYIKKFNGISLNIAEPIFFYERHYDKFFEYLHIDTKPCLFLNNKGNEDFYFNPLNNKIIKQYDTLSLMLDDYYYNKDLQAKVKLKTNDLSSFVKKQIAKDKKKIEKLNNDLLSALNTDELKLYGELLLSSHNLKEKKNEEIVFNYYTNKEIKIPLDIKYTVLENSNRYFKKYQKSKNSISYINEQIKLAQEEIEYFEVIKYQLSQATINEALEIQDELINLKYLFKNKKTTKKNQKPKILTYIIGNTTICVGKNNIQNEYITHKLAKSNEYWFHIQNAPGSHVLVQKSGELTEEEIRCAANLAAYYSSMSESSSVPVDYTLIRNIKKIPGRANCFVTYTHQKTIYIDPDKDYINSLKVKK